MSTPSALAHRRQQRALNSPVVDWLLTRDNLVRAMITGRKWVAADATAGDARGGGVALAGLLLVVVAAIGIVLAELTF